VLENTRLTKKFKDISDDIRLKISRTCNCITALAKTDTPITESMIICTYEAAKNLEVSQIVRMAKVLVAEAKIQFSQQML
jgi:hypothetical protein